MKAEFQVKLLQHLAQKKENKGFTLIELLVVIIIIGILSAIALPSFLNQANKAKESEAKQYVGSANRAQQAYFTEKNRFTTEWGRLGLGVPTETGNYKYSAQTEAPTAQVITLGDPTNTNTLRAYVGGVQIGQIETAGVTETTSLAILCQSKQPVAAAAGGVTLTPNTTTAPTCGTNYDRLDS
jgi:prepilin-type N-terminal cleavage/methylation domain-containing protein